MTVQPYMKFYCADWRADPRLRMCSLAAKGLWIDLMTYMHEGEPYGYLTIDGRQPDLAGIAALVGRPLKEVRAALNELEERNVFSRGDNGAVYSRRMVRDKAKAEKDRANGKGGGNPKLRGRLNGGVNPQDKAQIPEARDQTSETKVSGEAPRDPKAELFDRARQVFDRKSAGGLCAKLLKSFGSEDDPRVIAKARARIEEASTKANPAEWVGRVLAGPARAVSALGNEYPEGIT